jgi:hypothetical protein
MTCERQMGAAFAHLLPPTNFEIQGVMSRNKFGVNFSVKIMSSEQDEAIIVRGRYCETRGHVITSRRVTQGSTCLNDTACAQGCCQKQ